MERETNMTREELKTVASRIEKQAQTADRVQRLKLQPKVSRLVQDFRSEGMVVPASLYSLNENLTEDVVEARFDNMPV